MTLSIGIPVYRAERYIERCARSLFGQTFDSLEFVFVDDCGGDGSLAVVERVLKDCPSRRHQVKIVRNAVNSGQDLSRLKAAQCATGEWMAFCDADDWVDENFYGRLMQRMEQTDADMAFAPLVRNESEVPTVGMWHEEEEMSSDEYLDRAGELVAFNSMVNKIYRRDWLLDPSVEVPAGVRVGEDMCRTVQLAARCSKIASVTGTAYHYRVNAASASRRFEEASVVRGLMDVFDLLDRKLPSNRALRLRKLELMRILFLGVRFGVLSKADFRRYDVRLRTLDAVSLLHDPGIRQRMLLAVSRMSYPLAKSLAFALRWWRFKGF